MKKQTKLSINGITRGSYFVSCWGYDQTQYSIYKVVKTAGNSTVYVEPQNSWGDLSDSQLAEGSIIKAYDYKPWDDLTDSERNDYQNRNFDRWSYNRFMRDNASKDAAEVEIIKRKKGDWTYVYELSDGRTVDLHKNSHIIEHVRPLKKCIVNFKWDKPAIKIDDVITARLDPDYMSNHQKYEDQNTFTYYNGR